MKLGNITILRKNEVISVNYERVNWSGRNWKVHTLRAKPRKERKTASEMKTFQRYLSSISKGSIAEVLDRYWLLNLTTYWQSFFERYRTTDDDDWWTWHPVEFAAKSTEVPFRRQVSFHCPFTIQKAIGDTRAVQSTNSLAVTQASLNMFKDHHWI